MKREDAEEYTQSLGQIGAGWWRQIMLGHKFGAPEALGLTTEQWIREHVGRHVKLSIPDKGERLTAFKEMKAAGMTQREIGAVAGVDHATVSRALGADAPELEETNEETSALGADAPELEQSRKQTQSLSGECVDSWFRKPARQLPSNDAMSGM